MANPVLVNGVTGVVATAIFVRGGPCSVADYHIHNPAAATSFVQFFDSPPTVPPTVGTTVPKWSIGVPTLQTVALDGTLNFVTGLWVAATTTVGGNSAPSAAVNVNLAVG